MPPSTARSTPQEMASRAGTDTGPGSRDDDYFAFESIHNLSDKQR
jgi:hypothetical protein